MRHLTIGQKMGWGLGLALIALVVVGGFSYAGIVDLLASQNTVTHTLQIIAELHNLQQRLVDVETGGRGYVITADPAFLEPYQSALPALGGHLDTLASLTADNPTQQQRVTALRPLVQARLTEAARVVALRQSGGFEAAQAAVQGGRGKAIMDDIRAIIGQMEAEALMLLEKRQARAEQSAGTATLVTAVTTLLTLSLVGAAGFSLTRGVTESLRTLMAGADELGQGNLAHRVEVTTRDEVGRLALNFNRMAESLQAADAALRRANEELETRVADRTAELSKTNRALRTISDCNQALVRAESESDLLNEICRIIVETGGYLMAWVGLAEQDEDRTVRPAAWAGEERGYLHSFRFHWREDEGGLVPISAAIRTGQPALVRIASDPANEQWRAEALRRGYAACIALPLVMDGRAFGALSIFAADPAAFDAAEVKLLAELANDLAYGVSALRTRAARARAEEALRRSDDLLRQTSRLARVGGWELDLTTMTPIWSEETYRIHEVDPAEKPDLENAINFYAPEVRPVIAQAVERAIAHGEAYNLVLPFITAKGKRLWVRAQGQPEFRDGKCVRLSGTFQDITEQKLAEEAVRLSEARLAGIVDHAMDAIISVDESQQIVLFNAAAEQMFRCPAAEAVGRPLDRFIPERFRAGHRQHIRLFGETGATGRHMGALGELFGLRADGREFPLEASISQIDTVNGKLFTVILRDITERRQAEAALRASEAKYRTLFETMTEGFCLNEIILDENGQPCDLRFLEVNPAFEAQTGMKAAEITGRTIRELYPLVEPFWFERYGRVALTGQPDHFEAPFGAIGRWFDVTAYQTAPGQFAVVFVDITERRRADEQLRATLVKLEQNNRELQDFAYVASHDLQEPLRKIQAFGDRLVAVAGDSLDERGRDYLRRMHAAAARMQVLIDDLLSFSRVTTKAQPFARTDLNSVLAGVVSDLEARIEKTGGRIEAGPLPALLADATQMRQMLQNLLGNALKFHRPGQPPLVRVHSQPGPEGGWQIIVSDNGIGFDEKYLDRIFAPFQRLHGRDEYEGTGIGLAVVRKIVERHGGAITARSAPGQGATFIVTFPKETNP